MSDHDDDLETDEETRERKALKGEDLEDYAVKRAKKFVRKQKKAEKEPEERYVEARRDNRHANSGQQNRDLWPFQPRSSFERMLFSHAVWPLVHRKLHDGESYRVIAEYLVDHVRDFVDFKALTLLKYLHNIGKDMPTLIGKRIMSTQIHILKDKDEIPEVDARTLLNFCAAIQTERVMLGYEYEAKAGKLLQQTHQEIRLLADIAEGVATLDKNDKPLKVDLSTNGLQNEQALQDTFRERFGAMVGGVIGRPDARRRVLNAFQLVASREAGALKDIVEQNDIAEGASECSSETQPEELSSSESRNTSVPSKQAGA